METTADLRFAAACDERHARESDAADAEHNRRAALIWCDWCGDYEVAAEGQRCAECIACEAEDNHEPPPLHTYGATAGEEFADEDDCHGI